MCRLVRDDRKTTVTQITTRHNQGLQNTISGIQLFKNGLSAVIKLPEL